MVLDIGNYTAFFRSHFEIEELDFTVYSADLANPFCSQHNAALNNCVSCETDGNLSNSLANCCDYNGTFTFDFDCLIISFLNQ